MDRLIDVRSQLGSEFFPRFPEILAAIASHGRGYAWTILDLREFSFSDIELDNQAFTAEVDAAPHGLQMSFDELVAFAASTTQIIDGLFIGCTDPASFPESDADDATVLQQADVVLAALDSTLWMIGGPESLLASVEASFETQPEPPRYPLRTW